MPTYNDLRPDSDFLKEDFELTFPEWKDTPKIDFREEKRRTIRSILELRKGLSADVAPRKTEGNLLVASWNIKEFGHTTQRIPEAYFYMAEIIARFDLVAVQEVKSRLRDLQILMKLLGEDWSYIVNDITEGKDGNSERSAYLYNRKRVEFGGLAGEIVLWNDLTEGSEIKQLKRTPYITGFRAAWKTFSLVNIHLQPGSTADNVEYRKEEVRLLLAAIANKIEDKHFWNENLILAGDFNLYDGPAKDDPTIAMIHGKGYREVESLVGVDTNVSKTDAYDRLFLSDEEYFKVAKTAAGKESGGVFDYFRYVYRDGDEAAYKQRMLDAYGGSKDLKNDAAELKKYYESTWRRNQLSDHFPIWFELVIDSSDDFLRKKLAEI